MNVFMYNNLLKVLELNEPEILLVKEFGDLLKRDKSSDNIGLGRNSHISI